MSRYLAILIAAALAAGTLYSADAPAKTIIRWHGHSFFDIESSKGTRIAIDPHAIDAYGRTNVSADIVLISHEHNDHNQFEVITNYAKAKIIHGLKLHGKKLDWDPVDQKIKDVHIRSVGVYHDSSEGMEKGKNTIFIIEVDGLHIVHLGDLGHLLTPRLIKQIGPVDVLMIPVGGVYTINGSDAKQLVEQLKPRLYILPMHYGTKVFDDVLPADEFLEDQKNVENYPSNKLTIEAGFKPTEPIIAVLDWKEPKSKDQ